ncbi:MAG: hypothetical protein GX295_11855 [Syntrophomonadaceae bacterium]|nr:hypothetical protein [Syntrophomonadaceae bacterium]
MYFVNSSHEQNFNNMAARVQKMKIDREYRAVGYIMSLPELHRKTARYFSDDGFNTIELFENVDLSSGYKLMVVLAEDLFRGEKGFCVSKAMDIFDDKLYKVMLQAIEIRRG